MRRYLFRFLTVLLAAACLFPALAAAESVYKWTDDEGNTHFGDRQPVGRQAESVNIRTGQSQNGGSSSSARQQLEQIDERRAQENAEQEQSAAEQARQQQRQRNCETARNNLNILQAGGRIQTRGEDGERRYLSEEEIEQKRQQFQAIADDNCGEQSQES